MQKYSDVVLDKNGKAVQGATVTVITYPAGQPATIYAADGGPSVASVATDLNGRFAFYAANGHYSITITGTGITPITYNDVSLVDPNDSRVSLADYASLRAYAGARTEAYVTGYLGAAAPAGIAGQFVRDDSDTISADNGGTIIVSANGKRWKRANAAHITGAMFGAIAGVQSDQSAALQRAWDAAAGMGVPFVVDAQYWIDMPVKTYADGLARRVGLQVPSNSKCVFQPGSALKMLPNDYGTAYGINAYLADNFEIWNPVVYGERNQHTGTTGESVNCFNIVNCTNAYIHRPIAYDAWGDGIYLGIEFYSATNKQTDNVTLFEPRSYTARRNGISVTSGRNLQVIRPHAESVSGTLPSAGMDLEPEGQGATPPICDNWRITEPTTRNCAGAGINVYTNGIASGSSVDIRVDEHKDYGSVYGAIVQAGDANVSGSVVFSEPIWKGSKNNGLILKTTNSGPRLFVINPVVEDCGAAQSTLNPLYDSAYSIFRATGDLSSPTMGNFSITGARARDTRASKKMTVALYSNDQAGNNVGAFTNAVFDLVEDSSSNPWRFTLYKLPDATVKISTGERAPFTSDATRGNDFFRSIVVPSNNAAYRTVNLGTVRQPISLMSLCSGQALSIYPDAAGRIYPTGTAAGKAIYSYDAGASINLYPINTVDWVAEIVGGTWTSA